jgi:hypothetical protein
MKSLLSKAEPTSAILHVDKHPRVREIDEKQIEPLREALKRARQRRERAVARKQAVRGAVPGVAAALVAGGRMSSASPDAEIEAAEEEELIVNRALLQAQQERREIVGELSVELVERFRDQHNDALRSALHHMEGLNISFAAIIAIEAGMLAAGYKYPNWVLKSWQPPGAYRLGDPVIHGTESFAFKKMLTDWGVI